MANQNTSRKENCKRKKAENSRKNRQNFVRKFSREQCNFDVLNRLLLTLDPFITSIRPMPQNKKQSFSREALEMLLPSEPGESQEDVDIAATSDGSNEEMDDFPDDEGWEWSS